MSQKNIELQKNSPETANSADAIKHYEKLKNSGEKGFFENAGDKISGYYNDIEKSIKKDIKEKNWGKLLLKGAMGLGGLWLAKKATEMVASTTKSILEVFGFGKDALNGNKEKTEGSLLGILAKIGIGGSAAILIYQAFKGKLGFMDYIGKSPSEIAIMLIGKIKDGGIEMTDDLKKALYEIPGAKTLLDFFFKKEEIAARTDRHNNPTAIKYKWFSGKISELKDENGNQLFIEGRDFKKGDVFENDPNSYTIKFKDKITGIKATIAFIDKFGFKNGDGNYRWDYIGELGMSNEKWGKLDKNGKLEFLKKMYKREGGNGKFFDGISIVEGGDIEKDKGFLEKANNILKKNPKLKSILEFIPRTAKHLSKDLKEKYPNLTKILPDLEKLGDGGVSGFLAEMLEMGIGEDNFKNLKEISPTTIGTVLGLYLGKKFVEGGSIKKAAILAFITYGLKKDFTFFDKVTDELGETITDVGALLDNVKNGNIANIIIGKDGNLIATMSGLNPVSFTFNIGQGFIATFNKYLEENDMLGMIYLSASGIFVGKALGHGLKGQYELLFDRSLRGGLPSGIWRTLMSCFPFTKEWFYVLNSAKEGLPFYKFYEKLKIGYKLGSSKAIIEEINYLIDKDGDNFSKINDLIEDLKIQLPEVNTRILSENKTMSNFYKSIRDSNNLLGGIAKASTNKDKVSLKKEIENFSEKLGEQNNISKKIVSKMKLLSEGKIFELMNLSKTKEITPEQKINLNKFNNDKINQNLKNLELKNFLDRKKFPNDIEKAKFLEKNIKKFLEAEKKSEKEILEKLKDIKKFAKENKLSLKSPEILEKTNVLNDKISEIAKKKGKIFEKANKLFKELPENLKTDELITSIKKYKNETILTKIKSGAIGRVKLMAVMGAIMVGVDTVINFDKISSGEKELSDILKNLGPDMIQLLIDILPFVGTASNFYSAFGGEEVYTGKTVNSNGERISNFLFGIGGAITDVITLTGIGAPVGITGRIGLAGLKLGKNSKKFKILEAAMAKISKIAEKTSWKEVAINFKKIVSTKKVQAEKVAQYATYGGLTTIVGTTGFQIFYGNEGNIDSEIDPRLQD